MNRLDYTPLDLPQITHYMFYPRPDSSPPPTGALDHTFPSHDGVQLCARFFPNDKKNPTILFFHGNGEVAPEYDDISSLYNHIGLNLFVADYRGYGKCQGEPSVSALVEDSHTALAALETLLSETGYAPSIYVMGRSLGAYCAVEIAAGAREKIRGMIIESGSANVGGMPQRLGIAETPVISQLLQDHWARVRSIDTPLSHHPRRPRLPRPHLPPPGPLRSRCLHRQDLLHHPRRRSQRHHVRRHRRLLPRHPRLRSAP